MVIFGYSQIEKHFLYSNVYTILHLSVRVIGSVGINVMKRGPIALMNSCLIYTIAGGALGTLLG